MFNHLPIQVLIAHSLHVLKFNLFERFGLIEKVFNLNLSQTMH